MTDLTNGTVLVTGASVHQHYLDQLRAAGLTVINPPASFPPDVLQESVLREILSECDAYLLGGDEVASRSVLAAAPRLKVVAFLGVGYRSFVDAEAAADLAIAVTNTPGVVANSVAEFAVGELIAARRKIIDYIVDPELTQQNRRDLAGHVVGLVGLGAVGTRIAEILTIGFRARVCYFSRTRKPETEAALGITYLPLRELVSEVEDLVVAVPDTPQTISMIDQDLLAAARTRLSVINLSRPEIIAPKALRWGLQNERLESVWFDDYYRDPTPDLIDLRKDPRIKVTPHIASLTHDARDAMAAMAVSSLLNVLLRGSDQHIVNGAT
jgi:lactate dehydrogenase-like 2-hydroxyacid dehydrogenase